MKRIFSYAANLIDTNFMVKALVAVMLTVAAISPGHATDQNTSTVDINECNPLEAVVVGAFGLFSGAVQGVGNVAEDVIGGNKDGKDMFTATGDAMKSTVENVSPGCAKTIKPPETLDRAFE